MANAKSRTSRWRSRRTHLTLFDPSRETLNAYGFESVNNSLLLGKKESRSNNSQLMNWKHALGTVVFVVLMIAFIVCWFHFYVSPRDKAANATWDADHKGQRTSTVVYPQ